MQYVTQGVVLLLNSDHSVLSAVHTKVYQIQFRMNLIPVG